MLHRILLLFLVLLVQQGFAQQPDDKKYKVTGTVKGAWGERLEGAYVVFSQEKTALSDKQGRFTIMLSKGTYNVTCQFIGMAPFKETVTVTEDKDIVLT